MVPPALHYDGAITTCNTIKSFFSAPRVGYLKRTAVEEALLLLAHDTADGFGVNDVRPVLGSGESSKAWPPYSWN